eukprot:363537-Chlamydomonas_euryale.AAC.1
MPTAASTITKAPARTLPRPCPPTLLPVIMQVLFPSTAAQGGAHGTVHLPPGDLRVGRGGTSDAPRDRPCAERQAALRGGRGAWRQRARGRGGARCGGRAAGAGWSAACTGVCACRHVCMRACMRACIRVHLCVRACTGEAPHFAGGWHACTGGAPHSQVGGTHACACLPTCVRVCVRACVRACACACA